MAIILRGKRKGETVAIHQMSNDWISGDDGNIYNPTSLAYSFEEIDRLRADKSPGMFWSLYTESYQLDGSIKLKRRGRL